MNLIEMHIIQSFPVTCLNRDDVGAPKTAFFGGCQRARVSSQCWKRAIRLHAQKIQADNDLQLFGGVRTRKAAEDLGKALTAVELGSKRLGPEDAARIAADICAAFLKKKAPQKQARGKKGSSADDVPAEGEETPEGTATLLYFSPAEVKAIASAVAEEATKKGLKADFSKTAAAAVKNSHVTDAADISIFGRMVANEPSLTLEGAGLFSHALSTHRSDLDIDFFTAVEDRKKPGDDVGSAMMGTIEFNSACYYRYIGLNLDLLFDDAHLRILAAPERQAVLQTFIRAAVEAVPSARKNTMFGNSRPSYILGLRRRGQPLSLVNAFEQPVHSANGYVSSSVEALTAHWAHLKELYGLSNGDNDVTVELPPRKLEQFVKQLTDGASE